MRREASWIKLNKNMEKNGKLSPLISIIVATLNNCDQLEQTINSICSQNYIKIELIIIDGKSQDGTNSLIQLYNKYISHYISETDEGIYDAWNKGLRASKGDYICFIGAGDRLVRHGLSALVACALTQPNAELITSKIAIQVNGRTTRIIGKPWCWNSFRRNMKIAHVGALHSRQLFDKYGEFDSSYKIAGDYEFLLRSGPHLISAFLNEVSVEMAGGGVSHKDFRVFIESEKAKVKHKSVDPIVARIDRLSAQLKWYIRNYLIEKNK